MTMVKKLSPAAYRLWLDVRMRSFPKSREMVIPFPEWPQSNAVLELVSVGFMEQNNEGKFQSTALGYDFPSEFVKPSPTPSRDDDIGRPVPKHGSGP